MNAIGSCLRKARTKKSLSLDEIYDKTKIHPHIIEALENDRTEDVLSPVYIKSFLKTYSHYLGLDNDELIKSVLEQHADPVIAEQSIRREVKPKVKIDFRKYFLPIVAIVSILCLVSLVSFAGIKLASSFKNLAKKTQTARIERKAPVPVVSKIAFQPIAENENLVLELKTNENVWLEVKSDDKIIFRSVLPKGNREVWNANDSIKLWLGKAEAVDITLNGQSLGSPGRGVLKNVLFTRKGMKIGENR